MDVKKNHEEEAKRAKWQIRRGGEIISFGPEETLPDLQERKQRRADGYQVYVDGKLCTK